MENELTELVTKILPDLQRLLPALIVALVVFGFKRLTQIFLALFDRVASIEAKVIDNEYAKQTIRKHSDLLEESADRQEQMMAFMRDEMKAHGEIMRKLDRIEAQIEARRYER